MVENCIFSDIYDSGVTHQGGSDSNPPKNIRFVNNLFIRCGMASYECRGPAAHDVYFEQNICVNAGGDLSMQGEPPPRQSEIFPQPMGHHIFIWRIDKGTQTGKVYIRRNIFFEAPHGMAIYSVLEPEDERNFIIDSNCYHQCQGKLIIRWNGRLYDAEQFNIYQAETNNDKTSVMTDPMFT